MNAKTILTLSFSLFGLYLFGQNEAVPSTEALLPQEGPFPCIDGMAGDYPCNGYDLQGHLTNAELGGGEGNDCWGWTDPLDGKEYALMGMSNGTAFVDISDPTNPVLLGNLPTETSNSLWRDIKVHQNHAFIVSEAAGHGMQIFDLTNLRNVVNPPVVFTTDALYSGFGSAHNIVINESTGYAYPVGAGGFAGGPHFINISNPLSPVLEGGYDGDGYTHDAQVVRYTGPDAEHFNKEIFFGANTNTLTIVDVTEKTNPQQLARETYEGVAYTHQGWVTEDQKYYLMDDEIDENNQGINTRTLIWDIQDLDNPFYLGENLTESGFFDTYPENDNNGYDGAWSNYPYFPSGNIIISTIDRGLFIVKASESNSDLVNLDLDLILEGPYDQANGLMSDNLRSSGNIPLMEPYTALGYNVPSVNTTNSVLSVNGNNAIVDWILVELRNPSNPSVVVASQAALLQRDGDVVSADGSEFLLFDPVATGNIMVAVRHRNHFGIRTTDIYSTSSSINIDLTNPSTNLFGIDPTITIGGTSMLIGGDANNDGQVNAIDKNNFWRLQNANVFNYLSSGADFNLDGIVNAIDRNTVWRLNNSKSEQLD